MCSAPPASSTARATPATSRTRPPARSSHATAGTSPRARGGRAGIRRGTEMGPTCTYIVETIVYVGQINVVLDAKSALTASYFRIHLLVCSDNGEPARTDAWR